MKRISLVVLTAVIVGLLPLACGPERPQPPQPPASTQEDAAPVDEDGWREVRRVEMGGVVSLQYRKGDRVKQLQQSKKGQTIRKVMTQGGHVTSIEEWYADGTQRKIERFEDRKIVERRGWHPNGQLALENGFEDGLPTSAKRWNEEGVLTSEVVFFAPGKPEKSTAYYDSGAVKQVEIYPEDGEPRITYYDEEGNILDAPPAKELGVLDYRYFLPADHEGIREVPALVVQDMSAEERERFIRVAPGDPVPGDPGWVEPGEEETGEDAEPVEEMPEEATEEPAPAPEEPAPLVN